MWWILIINSLSFSLLIYLLAAGMTVTFGLMNIVNMAHGAYFMLSAYIGYTVYNYTASFIFALLAGVAVLGVIGFFTERLFLRGMHGNHLRQVLLTIGFIFIFVEIVKWIWGTAPYRFPVPKIFSGSIEIGSYYFPSYRLVILLIGLLLAAGIGFFMQKTKWGAILRAGVDNHEMLNALGVNIYLVFGLTFAFGAILAAIAGVLGAPILGVYNGLEGDALVLAFMVVIIGGIGSLRGAFLGALLIGVVKNFGEVVFPAGAMFILFGLMFFVLIIKPSGLVTLRKE